MSDQRWSNWAGNQSCECNVVAPTKLADLCEAVQRASGPGRRIRAAGGSYSWSPLIPNDDTIIRMHQLEDVIAFHPEGDEPWIEVQCGMSMAKLNAIAASRGLTIVSPTLFPKPTVGGALSTGSHGTDSNTGGFADAIIEMTIVNAEGIPKRVTNPHELGAAKVALGTFGIVYSIKLRLVKQFNVYTEIRYLPAQRVLEEMEDLRGSYEYLEIFWFPYQKNMWLYLMNPTAAPADKKTIGSRLKTDFDTWVENIAGKKMIPWLAKNAPGLTPVLNTVGSRLAFNQGVSIQTASDAFHFQHTYPKCWDVSYALPAQHAARAWSDAITLVDRYSDAGLYPVNLAVHGRFTGASDAWIAPDHGRPTGYVECTTAKGTPHWESFFRELETEWCKIPDARPHWGKLFWQTQRIRDQYPMMNEFLEIREQWDSERLFLNRFLENEIFQLPEIDLERTRITEQPPAIPAPPNL